MNIAQVAFYLLFLPKHKWIFHRIYLTSVYICVFLLSVFYCVDIHTFSGICVSTYMHDVISTLNISSNIFISILLAYFSLEVFHQIILSFNMEILVYFEENDLNGIGLDSYS